MIHFHHFPVIYADLGIIKKIWHFQNVFKNASLQNSLNILVYTKKPSFIATICPVIYADFDVIERRFDKFKNVFKDANLQNSLNTCVQLNLDPIIILGQL